MSTFDAWTYLIQNNLMPGSAPLGYMLSDKHNEGKQGDNLGDINHYRYLLEKKDLELKTEQMIRNKVITLLTTGESYRAVIAVVNEIIGLINDITGLGIGTISDFPRGFRVLGAEVHWPLVEHYLARDGEIMNVLLPVNPNGTFPALFEFSTDLDNTQPNANVNTIRGGFTLGYRHEWFLIEGGGVVATHRDDLSRLRALTGIGRLTIPIAKSGARVSFELQHQKTLNGNDPMNEIYGIREGTNATIILSLSW